MRVLYDYQIFSLQRYGGISRYFYELIKRIAKTEEVSLFEGVHINDYPIEKETYHGYWGYRALNPIPHTGMGRLYNFVNRKVFSRYASSDNSDVYHATYYEYHNNPNAKLIVTVYDMIHELFKLDEKTIQQKKYILQRADGIIAISEHTKKDLIEILGIDARKIRVIYLANSLKEKVNSERLFKRPYLLYVGNRGSYKNFAVFIQAAMKVQTDYLIECVCFGGQSFNAADKALISKAGLTDKVHYMAGPDSVLANLYKYAECFVYPSLYEGFGLPPLEAMHYGTPVIASNASCIPEVVGDAGLYFTPTEVDELYSRIVQVLNDRLLREDLRVKGYKKESEFSWDRCARETMEFYSDVLEGNL